MFDFGLNGRTAIACAQQLATAGAEVVLNARDPAALAEAAAALEKAIGRPVRTVAADVSSVEGRASLLAACPDPDILVNNAGGPPPGTIDDWDEEDWFAALRTNMIAPLQLIKAVLPAMRRRRWGRIINITSLAVKMPLPRLGLSNGARAGLTGAVADLARDVAGDGITINNLLPGRFATERLVHYMADVASAGGQTIDEAAAANPTKRLGDPQEFGAFCLFLASASAGYMTGQNILLDGGEFRGLL
jgi:3-oxoacyl-[acyl-carrier protein] reductase